MKVDLFDLAIELRAALYGLLLESGALLGSESSDNESEKRAKQILKKSEILFEIDEGKS